MPFAPEFKSVVVSRPGGGGRLLVRLRGPALAALMYGVGLAGLLLAPFLALEAVDPPRAAVAPLEIAFRHGSNLKPPAGDIRQGSPTGRKNQSAGGKRSTARQDVAHRLAHTLAPPPEPATSVADGAASIDGEPGDPFGLAGGTGKDDHGTLGGCPGCPNTEPGGPGDPGVPFGPDTVGLTPPSLMPGTRLLPKYPDLARRAGLQGTVILLAVIESDGTVGE